jgi:hypothetical protein
VECVPTTDTTTGGGGDARCSNFGLSKSGLKLADYFDVPFSPDVPDSGSYFPKQQIPIVRPAASGRELVSARWGIIPYFYHDTDQQPQPLNAKAETVSRIPTFAVSYHRRRCLIPLDHFYEWTATKPKQRFLLALTGGELFAAAGLWDEWTRQGRVRTATMITTKPNELAAGMQTAAKEALDVSREPDRVRNMYGLDPPESRDYGERCLLARRLVERGVRFVQIFLNGQPWDTHSKNAENLKNLCAMTDQPSAGLVLDLKRRGLLDSTVVMWTGGRPVADLARGRRPRPQPARVLAVARGRRVQEGVRPRGDGRLRVRVVRKGRSRPRAPRHPVARARPGPHEADVPARGARRHPQDVVVTRAEVVEDLLA